MLSSEIEILLRQRLSKSEFLVVESHIETLLNKYRTPQDSTKFIKMIKEYQTRNSPRPCTTQNKEKCQSSIKLPVNEIEEQFKNIIRKAPKGVSYNPVQIVCDIIKQINKE